MGHSFATNSIWLVLLRFRGGGKSKFVGRLVVLWRE